MSSVSISTPIRPPEPGSNSLDELLRRADLWQGRQREWNALQPQPTGHASLDTALQGGWPLGGLIECSLPHHGIGEITLFTPALRQRTAHGGLLLWIDPPYDPYPPALLQAGLSPAALVVVRPTTSAEWLWSCEQALRSPATSALFCWHRQGRLNYAALRKLQVAASERTALFCLFSTARQLQHAASPAVLRLTAQAADAGLRVRIAKRRGAAAGEEVLVSLPRSSSPRAPSRERMKLTPPLSTRPSGIRLPLPREKTNTEIAPDEGGAAALPPWKPS